MNHCQCPTCKLNGYQGRTFIEYSGDRYCTAHPQYLSIKRYKQAVERLGAPSSKDDWYSSKVVKPTVVTPPPRKPKELDTYVLSFRDNKGIEQDWFIKSDCDEDASNQAWDFMKKLPFAVHEFTFIREAHVKFIQLLNR